MTELKQERPKLSHPKLWIFALLVVIFTPVVLIAISKFIDWNQKFYFAKQQVLKVETHWPVTVREREETKVVEKFIQPATPEQVNTPIKKLICDTWGPYECLTAVAVSLGEGLNHPEDGFNVNSNDTIDVGPMRINSIHFTKEGCALQEVVFFEKNIKCAYMIWDSGNKDEDGKPIMDDGKGSWEPWVAWNTGAYLAHLDK